MSHDPSDGAPGGHRAPGGDRPSLGSEFDEAEVVLEILPDGRIRFEVGGVPGQGCEELEKVLLAALGSPVESREHTPEFYARRRSGVAGALKAWLGKK